MISLYVKSKVFEDELFQSEVSWSRNIQTEICENKVSKAQIGRRLLWYESLQKVDFFDHLPPSSCKRSLWTAPNYPFVYELNSFLLYAFSTINYLVLNCPENWSNKSIIKLSKLASIKSI